MANPTYFKGSLETDVLIVNESVTIPTATEEDAGVVLQGVAVADAAGAAPTAAEFDALLDSLRDAGIIATA
jgi:hypothetical protein